MKFHLSRHSSRAKAELSAFRFQHFRQRPSRRSGFAIVAVIIVVAVLTIMSVAFMQSMRIDRLTARAYLNKVRAEMAARAGVEDALARLLNTDLAVTVNAYEELTVDYQGSAVTAPYLTGLELSATGGGIAQRYYLTSSTDATTAPGNTDLIDINVSEDSGDYGWIGLSDENGARKVLPVEWQYLSDSDGQAVARYAYWIDDECARIDLESAGRLDSSSPPTHLRTVGKSPQEVALNDLMENSASVSNFLDFRSQQVPPWPGLLTYLHAPGLSWSDAFENIKSMVTVGSLADERGAVGMRKINLNDWAAELSDFTTQPGRFQLAVKVVALGDYINLVMPDFATRYYRGTVSDPDKRLYCVKLAANIQDYIDSDSQPTAIRSNFFGWLEPPDPTGIGEGAPAAPPAAFGKEAVPAIGEYLGYYYNDGGLLRIDHSFETWNIHTKDITLSDLGTVQILVSERNDVTPRSGSDALDPDLPGEPGNPPLVFNLPNQTLAAGNYYVFTTVPSSGAMDRTQWTVGSVNWIDLVRGESAYDYGSGGLRMEGDQLASSADANTEICVVNEYGYLDINTRVAQQGPINLRNSDTRLVGTQTFGNEGTSGGNNVHRAYPLDGGDPRSFTEVWPAYSEGGGSASAIAWRRNSANSQAATKLGAASENGTYGILPDNQETQSQFVPEPVDSLVMGDAGSAISVIRDGNMETIGELGFIYDPAVSGTGNHSSGTRNRGGFRTLAVGSRVGELRRIRSLTGSGEIELNGPATLVPDSEDSEDYQDRHINDSNRADRLLELFSVSDDRSGKILLNSALRDPRNLPLRALMHELQTQTNLTADADYPAPADPYLVNSALTVDDDALIEQMMEAQRNTNIGPFLGLGHLADLPAFNTGTTLLGGSGPTFSPGSDNKEIYDRGREEIFRHIVERLTLKGSRYRIYVIAQAGEENVNGNFVVRASSRLMQIHELERTYPADSLDTVFPATPLRDNNTPSATQSRKIWEIQY
jgi:Tfp pilus assembly protein PilE